MSFTLAIALTAGILAAADLLLTVGVIRRLKQHSELLAASAPPDPPRPGRRVADFAALTVDGGIVSRDWTDNVGMVAFLSPGCEACEEALPGLTASLRSAGQRSRDALVVVTGEPDEAASVVRKLHGLATIVVESPVEAKVARAFGVTFFPTLVTVSGGAIDAVLDPMRLETPRPALAS